MNPQQPFQPPVTAQWPGAGPSPARPSGATGVLGGLLALACGLVLLVGMILQVIELSRFFVLAFYAFWLWLGVGLQGLAVVLLLSGGVLLCLRVGAARIMTVAGTMLLLVLLALTFIGITGFVTPHVFFHAAGVQDLVMLALVLALASSLLGLLPATARWVSTLRT
ncbi:hypothetical protein SAMN05216553_111195 [Lentzea fradiae]|uniref:Uncharacterized protein n=1 Tax=Lentzea fradiae TaxID=200378 RepID=A0A1G7X131_9PSEU|nr:hypothetical protein [Lentzea fradiae]SDG77869.1 hypothetical protein SAMN05216553_111195 [Lentzea fradiae]